MKYLKWALALLIILNLTACGVREVDSQDDLVSQETEELGQVSEPGEDQAEAQATPEPSPEVTPEPTIEATPEPTESPEPTEPPVVLPDYEALGVNEIGHILVAMYHGIKDDPPYHRTVENFQKDLQYMYDNGYRLISLEDYFSGHISVEAGYTPILLTFDDGLPSTFHLEEVDGEWVAGPETAVGMIEAFVAEHPDFGKGAAFFLNNNGIGTFNGEGTLDERLQWLVDHGYSVGNHTSSHAHLATLTGEEVQKELGKVDGIIRESLPGYTPLGLAYPYGERPAEAYRPLAIDGTYGEVTYHYDGAFAVGFTGWYYPPMHLKYNPLLVARARASEGEETDLYYFFDYYKAHPDKQYVSDGNPDTLVVPQDMIDLVDSDKAEDLEIITY